MEYIIKQFSDISMSEIAGLLLIVMFITLLTAGPLHTVVLGYMQSICG